MNVGITGHQDIPKKAFQVIKHDIKAQLSLFERQTENIVCVSSLALGADQIFANIALELGIDLHAIIPCRNYDQTFHNNAQIKEYKNILMLAKNIELLDFEKPSEEAFWAAGMKVVDTSDILFAVWDGRKARGLGGTADVVSYAKAQLKKVLVFWPNNLLRF